jgi:hypothetical protein
MTKNWLIFFEQEKRLPTAWISSSGEVKISYDLQPEVNQLIPLSLEEGSKYSSK